MGSKHNGRRTARGLQDPLREWNLRLGQSLELLQGEEFLMQRLAGWDMIQSFSNVWGKMGKRLRTTNGPPRPNL